MGLSSLLFGGLTLIQGRIGSGSQDEQDAKAFTIREAILHALHIIMTNLHDQLVDIVSLLLPADSHMLATSLLVICLVFAIAYSTRPSDASFRSYLTDLSLHQHLRHIHDQTRRELNHQGNPTSCSGDQQMHPSRNTSKERTADDTAAIEDWSPDQSSPHALTFANRISISLRTPPYVRHDYALFSIMMVVHPAIPCPNLFEPPPSKAGVRRGSALSSTTCPRCAAPDSSIHQSRTSWYVGAFGRWWSGAKHVSDKVPAKEERSGKNAETTDKVWGVLEMRTGEDRKKRGRSSPRAKSSVLLEDNAVEEAFATAPFQSNKAVRRKKQPHRLRSSQVSAHISARSAVAAQQQYRKPPLDETSRSQAASAVHDEQSTPISPQSREAESSRSTPETLSTSPGVTVDPAGIAAEAAVEELRSQLSSLKTSSEATRQQLQRQLDELRNRKRDEDTARSDLKGRMKMLDEGKRTAEAAKREAERRLKAAQSVKESMEKKVASAEAALQTFDERQANAGQQVKTSLLSGNTRRKEIEVEKGTTQSGIAKAEKNLEELRKKIESLEHRIATEQHNVKSAEQNLRERSLARAQEVAAAAAAAQSPPDRSVQVSSDAFHLMANGLPRGEAFPFGHPGSISESRSGSVPYQDIRPGVYEDYYRSSPHQLVHLEHGSRNASQDFSASSFGPTTIAGISHSDRSFRPFGAPVQNAGTLHQPEMLGQTGHYPQASPSIGHPVSANQALRHSRSNQDLSGSFTPTEMSGGSLTHSVPPVSPFSTDLLPSNLFANADDDESHPGVLPGSRSEAIEAALGRFGLDTSDQSDIDGAQSDRDTVDGSLNLDGDLPPLSEHGSEEGVPVTAKMTSSRNWWGSSKARQAGREVVASPSTGRQAGSDSDGETADSSIVKQQRKGFASFPRLSLNQLNPGAKVFRSSSRKQADANALKGINREGYGSQGYLGSASTVGKPMDWTTSSLGDHSSNGSHHGHHANGSGVSFDAVRRAFEASNPPDDEEGRRSWSAFDQWSQRQGFQAQSSRLNGTARLAVSPNGPAGMPRGVSGPGRRGVSDSVPSAAARSREDGFQVWPEDLFQPLDRAMSSHSAGASIDSSARAPSPQQDSSSLAQRERPTNRSRFAFWSQNSKGSLNSASSHASDPPLSSSASGGASNSASHQPLSTSVASGNSSGSAGQSAEGGEKSEYANTNTSTSSSKPKRSFRWSRRSQTANSAASVASDADGDEE